MKTKTLIIIVVIIVIGAAIGDGYYVSGQNKASEVLQGNFNLKSSNNAATIKGPAAKEGIYVPACKLTDPPTC